MQNHWPDLRSLLRPALGVFVVFAFATSASLANDPPVEIRACLHAGAPACTFFDGYLTAFNGSSSYWYKVELRLRAYSGFINGCNDCAVIGRRTNVILSPRPCSGGEGCIAVHAVTLPGCADEVIDECVNPPFPHEPSCCVIGDEERGHGCCDNPQAACQDGSFLCATVTGGVTVYAWSLDGSTWTDYATPVTVSADPTCFESDCEN